MKQNIRVIITGATGMVGEGVLHECLLHPAVASVLLINRKPAGVTHPKLKEIVHPDLFDLRAVENELQGYDACFFCLGVSSVGMPAEQYYRITYTLTMNVAETLVKYNPQMTFCYVSGAGTDSSEQGRSRWARVKGKTENDLMRLPFRHVYAFRPGFIKPIPGLKNTHAFYKYINWMFPVGRWLYPEGFSTLEEIGRAMIAVARNDEPKPILGGKDIARLAESNRQWTIDNRQ